MKFVALFLFELVSAVATAHPITFRRDVLPIFEAHCTGCHRLGGLGIMPLTNYEEARSWGGNIRAVVLKKYMPPWIVEAHPGLYASNKLLTQEEVEVIVRWVDGGSLESKGRESGKRR